jgi:hypothetical protein
MDANVSSSLASDLCLSCGMCCNGTLFNYAPLNDGEHETVVRLEISSRSEVAKDKTSFSLPCSRLDGARCTCYGEGRPAICGDYACKLLVSLVDGTTPFAEAQKLVIRTREISDRVRKQLESEVENDGRQSIFQLTRALSKRMNAAPDPRTFRRERGELFLGLATLRMSLESHFQDDVGDTGDRPLWSVPSIETDD